MAQQLPESDQGTFSKYTGHQTLVGPDEEGVNVDLLLDVLVAMHTELHNPSLRKEKCINAFVTTYETFVKQLGQSRLGRKDFDIIRVIGRGAFGEVRVCRCKLDGKVYALKLMQKWDLLKRLETTNFMEERMVLLFGRHEWFTRLHYAFQDEDYLCLVLEYYPGGDLLTLLSKFEDRITEPMARFYIAEMVLAIDTLHQLGFAHRDIKPDNMLLTQEGHLRLGDFGSCIRVNNEHRIFSRVAVGTPDYISPEILQSIEGKGSYGVECDWWSLGICLYEMLVGQTPFYAETLLATYSNIINHTRKLQFPADSNLSPEAISLIKGLLASPDKRFGVAQIKSHPFFNDIDWKKLATSTPPYVPNLSNDQDTTHFEAVESAGASLSLRPPASTTFIGSHFPFLGYTYTGGMTATQTGRLDNVAEESSIQRQLTVAVAEVATLRRERRELDQQIEDLKHIIANNKTQADERLRNDLLRLQASTSKLQDTLAGSQRELGAKVVECERLENSLREALTERDATLNVVKRERPISHVSIDSELMEENEALRQQLLNTDNLAKMLDDRKGELDRANSETAAARAALSSLNTAHDKLILETTNLRDQATQMKAELMYVKTSLEEARQKEHSAIQQLEASTNAWEKTSEDLQLQITKEQNTRKELEKEAAALRESLLVFNEAQTAPDQFAERVQWQSRRSNKTERMEMHALEMDRDNHLRACQELEERLAAMAALHETQMAAIQAENKALQSQVSDIRSPRRTMSKIDPSSSTNNSNNNSTKSIEVTSPIAISAAATSAATAASNTVPVVQQTLDATTATATPITTVASNKQEPDLLVPRTVEFAPSSPQPQPAAPTLQTASTVSPHSVDAAPLSPSSASARKLNSPGSVHSGTNQDPSMIYGGMRRATLLCALPEHAFTVTTISTPTACQYCQSLLRGLIRQALVCSNCQYLCHSECAPQLTGGHERCPSGGLVPSATFDPLQGVGIAREGSAYIPKPGGVRKGWRAVYMVLSDYVLYIYEQPDASNKKKSVPVDASALFMVDLRDPSVVTSVVASNDCIHASAKELSRIFRISYGSEKVGSGALIVLVDTVEEHSRWVTSIRGLQDCAQRSSLPPMPCISLADSDSVHECRRALCAETINNVLLLGTSGDLLAIDTHFPSKPYVLSDLKRVSMIRASPNGEVFVALCEKTGMLHRFQTVAAVRGRDEGTRMPETKGCSLYSFGVCGNKTVLAVVIKKRVILYSLTNFDLAPYHDFSVQSPPTQIDVLPVGVCVAHDHTFTLCEGEGLRQLSLINTADQSMRYLKSDSTSPFIPIQTFHIYKDSNSIKTDEILLCFNSIAVFVGTTGMRTREQELRWSKTAVGFAYKHPHLYAFSDNAVEVIDVDTGALLRVLSFSNMQVLNSSALLLMLSDSACTRIATIVPAGNGSPEQEHSEPIFVGGDDRPHSLKRFASAASSKPSTTISGPQGFQHLSHVGISEVSSTAIQHDESKARDMFARLQGYGRRMTNTSDAKDSGKNQAFQEKSFHRSATISSSPASTHVPAEKRPSVQIPPPPNIPHPANNGNGAGAGVGAGAGAGAFSVDTVSADADSVGAGAGAGALPQSFQSIPSIFTELDTMLPTQSLSTTSQPSKSSPSNLSLLSTATFATLNGLDSRTESTTPTAATPTLTTPTPNVVLDEDAFRRTASEKLTSSTGGASKSFPRNLSVANKSTSSSSTSSSTSTSSTSTTSKPSTTVATTASTHTPPLTLTPTAQGSTELTAATKKSSPSIFTFPTLTQPAVPAIKSIPTTSTTTTTNVTTTATATTNVSASVPPLSSLLSDQQQQLPPTSSSRPNSVIDMNPPITEPTDTWGTFTKLLSDKNSAFEDILNAMNRDSFT